MRKIISREEVEKKRKRNQLIVGIVLIGVMVFGTLGYAFQGLGEGKNDNGGDGKVVEYNRYSFTESGGYWSLGLGDLNFLFKYNPEQIERIGGDSGVVTKYSGKPLYIYSESDTAKMEILRNIQYFPQRIQNACPKNKVCEDNIPLKTCEDNFIIIEESESSVLKQEGNCTFISGNGEEVVKISDEFLFKILGIV